MTDSAEATGSAAQSKFTPAERMVIGATKVGAVTLSAWAFLCLLYLSVAGSPLPPYADPSRGAAPWKMLVVWPALGVATAIAWLVLEGVGEALWARGGLVEKVWPGASTEKSGFSWRRLLAGLVVGGSLLAVVVAIMARGLS